MLVGAVVIFIGVLIVTMALCKAAGDADRKSERLYKIEVEKRETICTNTCLHCDQNDWCWFSDVKLKKMEEKK